jgi:hypothetical protein
MATRITGDSPIEIQIRAESRAAPKIVAVSTVNASVHRKLGQTIKIGVAMSVSSRMTPDRNRPHSKIKRVRLLNPLVAMSLFAHRLFHRVVFRFDVKISCHLFA